MELSKAEGLEEQQMARNSTTEAGEVNGPREPPETEWLMVSVGIEGGRSIGARSRSTGHGGTKRSEAGCGAMGSSRPGGVGFQQVHDVSAPLRGGCGDMALLMVDDDDWVAGLAEV